MDGSGSGFGSWKTVPAVPVLLSVSGKTVPTVPVSGSGSVPEPPCKGQNRFRLFHKFSRFFRIFPPGLSPSKQRVLAQGEQKRRKDNKRNRTSRCCTLVVARLSSSYVYPKLSKSALPLLGGCFGYFLFSSARGGGRGSPRRWKWWGGRFLLKIPGRGGVSRRGRGREGVCGELRNWGGGGLNIFFRGRNVHQV